MIQLVILSLVSALIGLARAAYDVLQENPYSETFFYGRRIFSDQFFNPAVSWKNQFKGGGPAGGPKYFGSTSFLRWTTAANYLFYFLYASAYPAFLGLMALNRIEFWEVLGSICVVWVFGYFGKNWLKR